MNWAPKDEEEDGCVEGDDDSDSLWRRNMSITLRLQDRNCYTIIFIDPATFHTISHLLQIGQRD